MDEVNRNKWHNYYSKAEESNIPPPWESSEPLAALVEFIEGYKGKVSKAKCVEFGSGSSCSSIYLAEQGFSVDAVDICPQAIERAKRFKNAHLVNWKEVDLLEEDLFDAHLKEGDYDLVFDMQCFHVLRLIDEKKAAENIYRALKPGGTAIVVVGALLPESVTDTTNTTPHDNIAMPGPPLLTLDELRLPLEAAGLTTVHLSLSRFNSTPSYANIPGGLAPLAWVGVFQKVLWSSEEAYALEVQAPFSTYILQGLKTIETRAYALPKELLHRPIYLLESAKGRDGVSSVANFVPARVAAGGSDYGSGCDGSDTGNGRSRNLFDAIRTKFNSSTPASTTAAANPTPAEVNAAADLLIQRAAKKGKLSRVLARRAATAMRVSAIGEPSDDVIKAFGGGSGGSGGAGSIAQTTVHALANTTADTTFAHINTAAADTVAVDPDSIATTTTTITTTTTATTTSTTSAPRVIGSVVFISCAPYTTQESWERDRALHMVPLHSAYDYCDDTGVQRFHSHNFHLKTQERITLKEGKISELQAWNVGSVEVKGEEEFPALQRVYRSIFKVVT